MRRQTLIALGAAIVLGLFAVYLANTFLSANEKQAAVVQQGMTKVAVAAVPLDYGVPITPDKIRLADFPVGSVPAGSFSSMAQLMSGGQRVALREMAVNEPVLASKISGQGQGASIAALLPDGKRAAAVSINEVSGVAGFIRPNDSVDVFITREVQAAGDRQVQMTDVLLQNIRVIATDQDAKSADGKPALAKTATLEVDPLEAQKLALAQQVGQISLVLRKPGEQQNNPSVETVSLSDLRYSLYGARPMQRSASLGNVTVVRRAAPQRTVRRAAPAAAPRRPATNNVEIVRGTQGNNYEVGTYGS